MTATVVSSHTRDGVAWIALNRPEVLNALDREVASALADRVEAAAADPAVTAVVVRGEGRAFCSGIDRTALAAGAIDEAFYRVWNQALDGLEDMPKLTLAVLHGFSIGGGLQLALACDLRLATDDAVLGLGATRHGLVPDGAVLRLARVIGLGRAKALALLNEQLTPSEAHTLGLVNWVCRPAALERTLEGLVRRARAVSPTAVGHTKRLLHASFHRDPRGMIEALVDAQRACMASWELEEANLAWRERREAVYHPPRPPRA